MCRDQHFPIRAVGCYASIRLAPALRSSRSPSGGTLVVGQPVTALDQLLQLLDKACRWRTVNNVVIEADRHTQVFANRDVSFHHTRFCGDSTECEAERMHG